MATEVECLEVHLYTWLVARWPLQTTGSFMNSTYAAIKTPNALKWWRVWYLGAPKRNSHSTWQGSRGIKVKCSMSGQLSHTSINSADLCACYSKNLWSRTTLCSHNQSACYYRLVKFPFGRQMVEVFFGCLLESRRSIKRNKGLCFDR